MISFRLYRKDRSFIQITTSGYLKNQKTSQAIIKNAVNFWMLILKTVFLIYPHIKFFFGPF